ncbi:interleukin-17 receptor E [Clinocottus analis]|uniref:interleukin-17 receptor E n=1 Tax=Clinocottus analis TaxID=304258 RepID=UPI0035BF6FF4
MRFRRVCAALALVAFAAFPLLLECSPKCHEKGGSGLQNDTFDPAEGNCSVELTSVLTPAFGGVYSECVTVRVVLRPEDFCKAPKIEVLSSGQTNELKIISPVLKKDSTSKCAKKRRPGKTVKCNSKGLGRAGSALWELVHDCVEAEANAVVSASYSTTEKSCSVRYKVPDPIPDFDLSVIRSSKVIVVAVKPGDKVHARWCYRKYAMACVAEDSPLITIDPSLSGSALLSVPYLLPCVCVQVYYTRTDSRRDVKCPFLNESIPDVRDVWLSSVVTLHESSVTWSSLCSAGDLNLSTALCWRQHEHLCTPFPNATLKETEDGADLIYNTSAVDKHPQMCLQFSLQGSDHISCPFYAGMSSWEVNIRPGSKSVHLYLTSSFPATFSAQLCVLSERGCSPVGRVHSVTMERNSAETTMNVPLRFLADEPCVQVWRSDPALHGRRVLCPDYTHNRCGLYAVAALVFVVLVALLGILIQRHAKIGAEGWLFIREPVLLVCSSEQSAHISAVCSLASVLQGELSAKVHMALWAQSSQTQAGAGVADLGPLPWLYGQWEAVREARGKVLIIWSPEATRTYEKWRDESARMDPNERTMEDCSIAEAEEALKSNERRLGHCKKEKPAAPDDKDWNVRREPSSVIAPVFAAALARLEGALQEGKGQGVALVYFQGLCHRRDIPKNFRRVPRYCLPQDFRGLLQELGGMRRRTGTEKFRWHCWPRRLLTKALSVWLARQLTRRLQTLLPQAPGKKTPGPRVTPSLKTKPVKTRGGLESAAAAAADQARPGSAKERQPLREAEER